MKIKGWVRTSLIDYPGHIATVLFTAGCNFLCPMCHNSELVLRPDQLPDLPQQELWSFLSRRAGLVDGVVITGGEPTLDPDLPSFLRQLRTAGFPVKLDTNGYRPQVLAVLLEEGLVDYVAMDVKAPPDKYPLLAGRENVDCTRLQRSIDLLQDSAISCEFRTTVIPGWLDEEDVEAIARWIAGARSYVLQQFRPQNTLDPALAALSPYPLERLEGMAARAAQWVEGVTVRGV
ncbi:MAG: anaerobic ribonucleoside-triphosphate reductase activating protein [Anaerolineae bacterium]|nr:anaerobic ribonucleoside-triphosphate reductase activating protein [Anaerolineae bacterium]